MIDKVIDFLEQNTNIPVLKNPIDISNVKRIKSLKEEEKLQEYFDLKKIEIVSNTKKLQSDVFPILAYNEDEQIIILGKERQFYKVITKKGQESILQENIELKNYTYLILKEKSKNETFYTNAKGMIDRVYSQQKKFILLIAISTFVINFLALAISFYSMQVYDRVIPTNGVDTLLTLTIGVLIAIVLETVTKFSRSTFTDYIIKNMDFIISRNIYGRFLSLRLDKLPKSVGTISSKLNNYAVIRQYLIQKTTLLFIDIPFILLFLVVITMIIGSEIMFVLLGFAALTVIISYTFKNKIEELTLNSTNASNYKIGKIVETVQNVQKIKINNTKTDNIQKWNDLSDMAINEDIKIKNATDKMMYFTGLIQQISYVLVVAIASYIITQSNEITMGAIIATTILSNKVFQPIMQLPNLFVLWGRYKISLQDLENLYSLPQDNQDIENPIVKDLQTYNIEVKDLEFSYYEEEKIDLQIKRLSINKGEKVAILGSIGSGKSTLLKILAGLYKTQQGLVTLDNIDINYYSRQTLSNSISYLPQDNSLFSGTLLENLTSGIYGVEKNHILNQCKKTGLTNLINKLPKGLEQQIPEGGEFVSGGQKQLIAFTRILIEDPKIYLLDEPTANMDTNTKAKVIDNLKNLPEDKTLVVVTHNESILQAVDRVIILSNDGVILDGPKEVVLKSMGVNNEK